MIGACEKKKLVYVLKKRKMSRDNVGHTLAMAIVVGGKTK